MRADEGIPTPDEVIRAYVAENPELSNREHARRTGAGRDLVGVVREEMESDGRLSETDSRVSGDGRVRPASQQPRPEPESDESPSWEHVGTIHPVDLAALNGEKKSIFINREPEPKPYDNVHPAECALYGILRHF